MMTGTPTEWSYKKHCMIVLDTGCKDGDNCDKSNSRNKDTENFDTFLMRISKSKYHPYFHEQTNLPIVFNGRSLKEV